MYVGRVPNRGAAPTMLLRESYRENGKVKSRTLANLTSLPPEAIEAVRRVLKKETLVSAKDMFDVESSRHHGHVQAVRTAMRELGMDKLLATAPSRDRDLVMAMIAARVLDPRSKLHTTRSWHATTIPSEFGVEHSDEETRTICTGLLTGCFNGKATSKRNSRHGTSSLAAWCYTT